MATEIVSAFLEAASARQNPATPSRPRLVFSLDATASRQPTWDAASHMTKQMFDAVAEIGGLDVSLVYFRGYERPVASPFVDDARRLVTAMSGIQCASGLTQINRLLDHVKREHQHQRLAAMVYIGDAMEEDGEELVRKASSLGVRVFVFHENPIANPTAVATLKAIADKSGGVYLPFTQSSIGRLGELLAGVAAFAAGGVQALADRKDEASQLLLGRMKGTN